MEQIEADIFHSFRSFHCYKSIRFERMVANANHSKNLLLRSIVLLICFHTSVLFFAPNWLQPPLICHTFTIFWSLELYLFLRDCFLLLLFSSVFVDIFVHQLEFGELHENSYRGCFCNVPYLQFQFGSI